ncbi:thiosulfate oxidation carrier protein SoxY [Microbaculum marinisediminis]|uniref:Thiosulfate oxidation carrier protein SoxY n=1 Tax=Microbaculum marinisediminis TaxID=2931392 RepID=A0AAW5QZ53_9HYPH|nr:thiosulfate oxidation carrier protein SoxY [Microbaculum sp. A6E488]MCT8973341.1 thiosulfate oxidation carrier protein SoxY [Microbaculum sp. A6E488]
MKLTRREALALSAGAAVFAVAGGRGTAWASTEDTQKAIDAFTGGAAPQSGRITLNAPEIAENGNTVPVSVAVDSPMTDDDYVAAVMILAEGNPNPNVATLHFTPMSGSADVTTRMRLAKTQNVIALAKMNDGSVFMDKKEVKVTIGGCGG